MPGFMVNGVGTGVDAGDLRPIMSYTWEILKVFGDQIFPQSVLVLAQECTLPTFTVESARVQGSSLTYKFADKVSWDDVRIVWYDIPRNNISLLNYIRKWRQRVWSAKGGLGHADAGDLGYKRESTIRVFSIDETYNYDWVLYGSWPSTIRDGDLTYTQQSVKMVTVNCTYDWAEQIGKGESRNSK